MKTLPERGLSEKETLDALISFKADDGDWKAGRTWSLVYHAGEDYTDFIKKAYNLYFSENALNPLIFKSLRRMENEVVQMTASMLHGDENCVGTMTSGGTESVLLAVKTYRDLARAKKRKIKRPEMIVPDSIHVAFEKAAAYFDVKAVHIPLNEHFTVDISEVEKRINENTILLIGSAPSYPHGIVDPIEGLSDLALKYNLPLHVDSCLGGFILPFIEEAPVFDFRLPGVTSISADVHKYGYGAKGASTIIYRNMDFLRHQFFVYGDWTGGLFASPALLGTRPGGAIAAAWAAMTHNGRNGYIEKASKTMDITRRIRQGIEQIKDLEILGNPPASVFAYRSSSSKVDIYAVGDQMEARGWCVDRLQKPDALHVMVTLNHERIIEQYLFDLQESVDYVKKNPGLATSGSAAVYGMVSHIPLRGMIRENIYQMMTDLYSSDARMPDFSDGSENNTDISMKLGVLALKIRQFWKRFKK